MMHIHRPGLQRVLNLIKGMGLRVFGTVVYSESKYYSIELSVITMGNITHCCFIYLQIAHGIK